MSGQAASALALGLLWTVTTAAQAAPTAVVTWNQAALAEVRLGRLGPPIVARELAVAHTCMYDAWAAYDARAIALTATSLPRRPAAEASDANKSKAVSFAAYRCLVNLFPFGYWRLQATMSSLGYDPADMSTNLATPQGIGNAAAAAVLASRRNDGSNQYGDLSALPIPYLDYTGYASVNAPMPFCLPTTLGVCPLNISNPYRWQPLINNFGITQRFVAPHWERVTPFALSAATQFDTLPEVAAGPNYLQSPARYQADLDQLLNISGALSLQQKVIVEYWADGPDSELPPGHWGLFAQYVSQRDGHSIDQDVKMFFAMHNASFDAGIAAWHLKRKYDGVRPITGMRYFKQGTQVFAWGGPGQPNQFIDGGKWTPYNPGSNLTPAFPGYISGHSTFSAASASVLRAFTGSDNFGFSTVIPAGFGRVEANVPPVPTTLSYATFTAAVSEAGISRLYAGIHFSDDNTVGQMLGNLAGQQAWAKAQFLFDGGLAQTTAVRSTALSAQSLAFTHSVEPLSNRLLLVGVATKNASTAATSVTYAGVALKRLGAQSDPAANNNRVELWYLVAPPVGQATVNVVLAKNTPVVAGAMSFNGVHQTAPFGVLRAANADSASACATLANEAAPLVAGVMAANADTGTITTSPGQTLRWSASNDPSGYIGEPNIIGTGMVGPGAPVAVICQYFAAKPTDWTLLAVPLKPAQ